MRIMKRGFTLIETLIYLALYTIIIGGALAAVYSMLESDARNETAAMVEEEGDFLIGKIDWVLSDTASVQSPISSGKELSITLADGSAVVFRPIASALSIHAGSAQEQILNNTDVSVIGLTFIHSLSTSDGLDPESVSASFTLVATTSDGRVLSRDFSTLEYLRK
jgi:type II secretory pathway pseudopilin PulG